MHIGLDFGGVIANHHAVKLEAAREMFGPHLRTEADVVRAALLPQVGEERYNELIRRIQARTLEFPLYPRIREAFERLVVRGYSFSVVSTQETVPQSVLEKYIASHALPIGSVAVVRADDDKRAACERLGVQAFLDDNPSVLETLKPLGIPLVWANFSRAAVPSRGFPSVRSWDEFEKAVEAFSPQGVR